MSTYRYTYIWLWYFYIYHIFIYIYINIYIYDISTVYRIIPAGRGCCPAVYHGTNPLGFVKVCLCQFFFTTLLMSDLGFRVYDVVCLETSLDSQVAMSPTYQHAKNTGPAQLKSTLPGSTPILAAIIYHISYFVHIYIYIYTLHKLCTLYALYNIVYII